jgi:hypothetical protein
MARCEEGYRCEVCGEDVEQLSQSDLYLRYVIGELDPEILHTSPERHLRCNPTLAQFIEHDGFAAVTVEGPFDRRQLDVEYVTRRVTLVTRGFARLLELEALGGDRDVTHYPLPEAIARYQQ